MAIESVATNPESYGADPMHGNFTDESSAHLWCANSLSIALQDPARPIGELNDDIQAGLRYLLSREVSRAMKASEAEHAGRQAAATKR